MPLVEAILRFVPWASDCRCTGADFLYLVNSRLTWLGPTPGSEGEASTAIAGRIGPSEGAESHRFPRERKTFELFVVVKVNDTY